MSKKTIAIFAFSLLLFGCAGAPTKEQVSQALKRKIPVKFEVVEIKRLAEIPCLFEVVLMADKQPIVLYMDKNAKFAISGTLMSLANNVNLTAETQKRFMEK